MNRAACAARLTRSTRAVVIFATLVAGLGVGAARASSTTGSPAPCPTVDSMPAPAAPGSPPPFPGAPGSHPANLAGYAVAMSGDTAIVTAPAASGHGSASVYTRTPTGWMREAVLSAADGAPGDIFGWSAAVSGDTAVIGAIGHQDTGAAFVFTRTGTAWTQVAKLLPTDFFTDATAGDGFGWSVAVSGETILVGAPGNTQLGGSAYVFRLVNGAWTQVQRLFSDDPGQFGASVALSPTGAAALIGEPFDTGNSQTGSATVYVDSGRAWIVQAKLTVPSAHPNDNVGWSVALMGDTALIGAPDTQANRGAAYVFVATGNVWALKATLVPPDNAPGECFGWSVSADRGTALVGAPLKDEGTGGAYLYRRSGDEWQTQASIASSDRAGATLFGKSVALSDTTAVVGAPTSGGTAGHADTFVLSPAAGGAAWSPAGTLTAG